MEPTAKTQTQFKNRFNELFAKYNTNTAHYARKFIVAMCWVGYYTATFMAVVLFVPGLLFKAAKIAVRVIKEGRA